MHNEIDTYLQAIIFNEKKIRKIRFRDEWWFVLSDLVTALTDTSNSSDYVKNLKNRDPELSEGWEQFVVTLPIGSNEEMQNLNCINIEGIFRIIQSIHSPKAEPFKRWLAKSGAERIQEIEDLDMKASKIKTAYTDEEYSNDLKMILAMLGDTISTKKPFQKASQGFQEYIVDLNNQKTNDEKIPLDPSSFISHKLVIDRDDI